MDSRNCGYCTSCGAGDYENCHPSRVADPRVILLREALESARNGLQWYQDIYPETYSGADDEMMTQIDAALSATKEN